MGAETIELEDDAVPFLSRCGWPGNVRELRNLAERIVVMHSGSRIGAESLKNLIQKNPDFPQENTDFRPGGDVQIPAFHDILNLCYTDAKELFEKQYLEFQLARNEGVISRTAEAIGIYPSNLHAKLRKYGIRTGR
jgi:two-component system nitrogen regulation response regulator NtrX